MRNLNHLMVLFLLVVLTKHTGKSEELSENTAPFFPAPKTTTVIIPNTRNSGSEVTTYTATDNDTRPEFNQVTYSMVTDATAASLFRLEPTSGRITLVSSLTADDAPRYLLTITATDNGGLSDTGTVTVSVNRNLNDPQWLPTGGPYSATVNVTENRPVLETVYTLSTQDLDVQEPFNTRIYSILSTSSAIQHFQISSQGNVQIIRFLSTDRAVNQYVLTIQLRDGGNRVAAQQFTLTVNVIRNTNPPVFFDTSYYQEIEETLAVGTSILRVQASDQDPELQFRTITYTLLANSAGNNLFSMKQGTGIIRVKSALTGNPTVTFNMVALAADGGSPSKSANAMVTIKVNRNRNTPVWNSLNYQATILETQTVALPLTLSPTSLSASDSDAQPPNNVVNYRLTAVVARRGSTVYANEQGSFAVSSTGQVTVRSPLIGLTATEYVLYVEAYDLGDPSRVSSSNATVTINLQRNRAPVFVQTSYTFDMNEDATVNPQTVVGQVLANDPDNGIPEFNTFSFAIENIGIGSPNAYLAIDSNGRITLQNIVSGIQDKEFRFLVRVSDNGVPSLTDEAVVTVNIKRNLWTPGFNPLNYAITIQETLPAGSEIGVTVSATDRDLSAPNNQVVYSANGDQSAIRYFDIDETSGKVLVKQPLYTGTSSQYILTVRVADRATPPLESQQTASVTITVERNQFTPVFQNLPTTRSLHDTAGFGFSVYTVFANDSDIRSPFNVVSYSLVSGTNQFQIDQTRGQITVKTNSLTQAEYVLTVEARDGADIPRRSYSTLTLTVDSNLEKPVWVNPGASSSYEATATIYETHDYVTLVFPFSANDLDSVIPYNTVRYVVEGNGNAPNFFTVADNGQTFLKTSLLQRTETQFVADSKARLTINVIRNKNAPQWQNPMTTTLVSQQAGVGQTVGNALLATDSDTFFNVVRYEIIGDGDSTAFFTIANPANGQITVANSLASSSDLVFYIRVRAYDNGVPAKDNVTVVTVTVERNNFAPEITSPTVSARIRETQDLGVTIATVTATDRDTQSPHNVIRFQMFASTPASDYFGIDSQAGTIFVKRDLTLDTSNRYLMYVQAYDMGSPSKTSATNATVTIDIYRNLRDPFFSGGPFAANIPETSVIETSILQINFGDSDTNAPFNTVTVSAIGDDKALTYFRLDSNNQIIVNSDLKADPDTQYLMRILAQDGGSPPRTATTVATITVQRNINSPVFERLSYNETILETRQLGLSFLQVKATDGDTRAPYNEVRYFMSTDAGSTLEAQYFMVDDVTGDISLRQSPMLDNARTVDYTFTVNAVDRGGRSATIPASVRVTVIRNTNAPVFTNLPNANQINHNTSIGTQVFPVSARDPDPGVFGQLTYSLTGDGQSTSVFNINPTSGVITVQQSLFFQTSTLYTLRVRVQDGGSPRKEAMNTLTLTVQRNFETPRFVSNSYTFTIKENEPIGFSVGQIVATDADSAAPNNVPTYTLSGNALALQYFQVNPSTGVVSLYKDLRDDTATSYTLTVTVADNGSPSLAGTNTATMTVQVNRNLQPPRFINSPYSSTITRLVTDNSLLPGVTIFTADDDIVSPFRDVSVSVIGDDSAVSLFELAGSSVRVRNAANLAADTAYIYKLRLLAEDGGSPKKTATTTIDISVIRNIVPPQFNPTAYNATILENYPVGSEIVRVSATDSDQQPPNNQIVYKIKNSKIAEYYFYLDSETGRIYLKQCATGKDIRFVFNVTATDAGFPALSDHAIIYVEFKGCPYCKVNLHSPRFFAPIYFVNIQEGNYFKNNLNLVQIFAKDDDDGYDGDILFDIQSVSNNGNDKFKLEQDHLNTNASIICSGTVNRGETYVIMVRASDQALQMERRRSSTVPVEVRVVS